MKVRLSAQVAEYKQAMAQAAQATRATATEADKAKEKLEKQRKAFDLLGKSMVTAGGLMAAGVAVAVKKFADFDEAMSNVAATGQDARDSIQELRDAAIEAGAKTVFSATESANAIEEMAKAGVDAKDVLGGGLAGALDLAAAGGLGVADAAGIAAVALKTFKLEGSDMSHVADLLAAGAGKAMGDVSDLSAALSQGGLVAAATGLSIEETTAALASFASQGLLGSDAGTSLKTMLQRLTPQSKEAADQFEALGISAYDANGQFVGLSSFAGQLKTAMSDLTPEARNAAMSVMFGSDAVRAANVLYSEGEAGIRKWIEAVDDEGYAAETARTKLDNLKGDWEALTGAVDSALISMGSGADGPLRAFTQGLTGLVDGFNKLPEGGKQAVLWVGAVGAAVTLAGGAYLLAIPKIAAYNAALATMGATAQRVSKVAGGVAKGAGLIVGLGLAASVLDKLTTAADKAAPGIERVLQAINKGDIDGSFANASKSADSFAESLELVAGSSFDSHMERIGETIGGALGITGVVTEARDGFVALDAAMSRMVSDGDAARAAQWFEELTAAAEGQGISVEKLKELFPQYDDALAGVENSAPGAADAIASIAEEADVAAGTLEEMKDALDAVNETALGMSAALDDAQGSLNDLAKAAKNQKASLKGTNDESIALRDAIREVETSHRDAAEAIIANGGELDEATAKYGEGRDAIFELLDAKGLDKAEAKDWVEKNLGAAADVVQGLTDVKLAADKLPPKKTIDVIAETEAARRRIESFISGYNSRTIKLGVSAETIVGNPSMGYGRASGGAIVGPGSGTSDDIPAWLSNGEHVLTADDVAAMGGQQKVYEWRRHLHDGGLKFASGGGVSASTKAAWKTAQRRGLNRAAGVNGDGLSLVDELLGIAADIGGKTGKKLRAEALKTEKAYLKLEKQSDKATKALDKAKDKLADLKDAAAAMASRVASAVRSFFDIGSVSSHAPLSAYEQKSTTVDGQKYTWADTSKPTVGTIKSGMATSAARIKGFADKLGKLAKMGLAPGLLAEIASLGVENGEPIADALLKATKADIGAINSSYADIGKYSDAAGKTVADANFEKLIQKAEDQVKAAKKNADDIRKQLVKETDRIIKTITGSLTTAKKKSTGGPIVGPGSGTSDDIPAWLSNGEHVWTAAEVQAAGGHEAIASMRRAVLTRSTYVPTSHRFAGGPVGAGAAAAVQRVQETVQVVLDRRVLAEALREYERSLS